MLVATRPRNRIMELLQAQGRSIYWLADTIGMSYQAIHRLVKLDEIPDGTSYGTLRRIADALDVSISDLENRTEN